MDVPSVLAILDVARRALSVHRYETADGSRWQVRWRDHTGRVRTRSVTSKTEATALDDRHQGAQVQGRGTPPPRPRTRSPTAYDEWLRLRAARASRHAHPARLQADVGQTHPGTRLRRPPPHRSGRGPGAYLRSSPPTMRDEWRRPCCPAQDAGRPLRGAHRLRRVEEALRPIRSGRMRKPPGNPAAHPAPLPAAGRRAHPSADAAPALPRGTRAPVGDACLVSAPQLRAASDPARPSRLTWDDVGQPHPRHRQGR